MHLNSLTSWLDTFLILPFRLPSNATIGLWLGCAILALYCTIIGEGIRYLFMKIHSKYYSGFTDKTKHYHDLSMKALHSGQKDAYLAANKLAHDNFGKGFFAKASVSMAILLPVPFALNWLSLRFEGIIVHTVPLIEKGVGYVFVFLIQYIVLRIIFSKIRHKILPQ